MTKKEKFNYIYPILDKEFNGAKTELNYENDYQLMVAVILSAQCTDAKVNQVTKKLFEIIKTPYDMVNLEIEKLEKYIYSVNYYKTKAKNLKENAQMYIDLYHAKMPKTIDKLIKLKGVGRKTANVLLYDLFNISEGIVVDTHVKRAAKNLGFTNSDNPEIIEKDLMKIVPKKYWGPISHYLILHGRKKCIIKKIPCKICELYKKEKK